MIETIIWALVVCFAAWQARHAIQDHALAKYVGPIALAKENVRPLAAEMEELTTRLLSLLDDPHAAPAAEHSRN